MAKWRALDAYSPFARALVDYMWTQRPPLLPNQFADRMGVRKQALSTWLNSDAVPAPPVVVRLARGMGLPVHQLMTAAGYASADDPLLDAADAWAYVRGEVEQAGDAERSALDAATPAAYEALLTLLHQLQDRTLAMARARLPIASPLASYLVDEAGGSDTPHAQDELADTAAVSSVPAVSSGDDPEA
jgi:transcriptional regulator with XRE-family HTH domain